QRLRCRIDDEFAPAESVDGNVVALHQGGVHEPVGLRQVVIEPDGIVAVGGQILVDDILDHVIFVVGVAVAVIGDGKLQVGVEGGQGHLSILQPKRHYGRPEGSIEAAALDGHLERGGGDLRPAHRFLIGKIVHDSAVNIGGDEHDVGDAAVVD